VQPRGYWAFGLAISASHLSPITPAIDYTGHEVALSQQADGRRAALLKTEELGQAGSVKGPCGSPVVVPRSPSGAVHYFRELAGNQLWTDDRIGLLGRLTADRWPHRLGGRAWGVCVNYVSTPSRRAWLVDLQWSQLLHHGAPGMHHVRGFFI
jgi:hypothetical protein